MNTFKEFFDGGTSINEGKDEDFSSKWGKEKEKFLLVQKQVKNAQEFYLDGHYFQIDPKEHPEESENLIKKMDILINAIEQKEEIIKNLKLLLKKAKKK